MTTAERNLHRGQPGDALAERYFNRSRIGDDLAGATTRLFVYLPGAIEEIIERAHLGRGILVNVDKHGQAARDAATDEPDLARQALAALDLATSIDDALAEIQTLARVALDDLREAAS
jgi:hypothetical protein